MYSYRVLVVDDDESAGRAVEISLELFIPKELIFRARSISQAKQMLREEQFDLAVLDISLEDGNGFELAEYVREQYPELPYIFATGYTQFALDGYRFQPVDFLVKPFSSTALKAALERVRPRTVEPQAADCIGIPINGGFHLLDVEQILYVEKTGRAVTIHFREAEDVVLQKYTMGKMEAILQDYAFIRVHQSFLVSTRQIESITPGTYGNFHEVRLRGVPRPIPISRIKYMGIKDGLEAQGIRFFA